MQDREREGWNQQLSSIGMSFQPPVTGNFACFALKARLSLPGRGTFTIAPGFYASTEAPFTIDDFWKNSLGTIETKHINECNLFLFAVSNEPSISTHVLSSDLHTYYYSLLIQGVGYSTRGISLFGPNAVDGMKVTALGRLPDYYEPPKVISSDVDRKALLSIPKLAHGINLIYANQQGNAYLRLRKGFNAFLEGIQLSPRHDRLHHFVRAVEAVIRPRQGSGTKDFRYRSQFFAGRTTNDQKLLTEIYELRSAAEHLNPLEEKLGAILLMSART